MEHVEVDDRTAAQAYEAKTWLANLQRACERFLYSSSLRPDQQPYQPDGGTCIYIYIQVKQISLVYHNTCF